ncbi:MAG: DUF4215 domain-containing protein, partial [Polyangiaceae bacterium]|nr:DUF4215 domain-containing protein [Polyangiaceae bacterium]
MQHRSFHIISSIFYIAPTLLSACGESVPQFEGSNAGIGSKENGAASGGSGNETNTDSDGLGLGGSFGTGSGTPSSGSPLLGPPTQDSPAPAGCGNETLDENEVCDDGNQLNNDGCWGNCLGIDPDYICPTPGELCSPFSICGDSKILRPGEQCDDGNSLNGDGCSENCQFELGYVCSGSPSACVETVCGNLVREGSETCEDGNDRPLDGCSATCQKEPTCDSNGCSPRCGDGIWDQVSEGCDDGNANNGDGCSKDCQIELGYSCEAAPCEEINGQCVLRVP